MTDPTDWREALPGLGVGLGYRDVFRGELFLRRDAVDFLEITTDHYIDAPSAKRRELDLLRDHFTLIPHSLDLSLGSADGVDVEYLEKIAEIVELVDAPWFSDHICFTRAGDVKIGHLAPVPHTRESLDVFARNIAVVRKRIARPLVLENITYLMRWPNAEMDEPDFIRTLAEENDCGLLLDVTNLYANSRNFGFDWREFLDHFPLERVVQLHFVGLRDHGGKLIDAHSDATQSEIWQVFDEVARRCDIKGAVLERDGAFPPFDDLAEELATARSILEKARE